MIPEIFAIVGAIVASMGELYYLYCTVKGTVKPNRVTWFFWGVFPMIAFAAQISQGVGLVVWATFIAGSIPFLVIFASYLNPDAYWKIKKIDYIFAVISILSIILWYITKNPNLALTFALVADLAVAIPTIIKSYKFPETENGLAYGLAGLGYGIGVLSIHVWTYENYAFLSYLFAVNLVITLFLIRKSFRITI